MRSDSFQRDEGRSTPTLLNTSTEEELLVPNLYDLLVKHSLSMVTYFH